jgi:predicted PurR-regulated permease PerM
MKDDKKLNDLVYYAIEITIRLGFLFLLLAWCFQLIYPFSGIVLWGVILAIAAAPAYNALNKRLGDKPRTASFLIILVGLIIILVPSWLFLESMIGGGRAFMENLDGGTLTIPPPSEGVAEWPLIGGVMYDLWTQASQNLGQFLGRYQEQVARIAGVFVDGIMGAGAGVLQFVVSTIIAGILLATKGTNQFTHQFFRKLVGERAEEFIELSIKTVGNVVKGVIGVALIQSVLVGLGFLFSGVPYAGIWALLVLILAILQLPPLIVILPIIVYLFSVLGPLAAGLWTVYLLLAGASDNILKPILLGKGAPVPMLIIFLGVVGGFIFSGFLGLFTGAIVLSLGYKLFIAWVGEEQGA